MTQPYPIRTIVQLHPREASAAQRLGSNGRWGKSQGNMRKLRRTHSSTVNGRGDAENVRSCSSGKIPPPASRRQGPLHGRIYRRCHSAPRCAEPRRALHPETILAWCVAQENSGSVGWKVSGGLADRRVLRLNLPDCCFPKRAVVTAVDAMNSVVIHRQRPKAARAAVRVPK